MGIDQVLVIPTMVIMHLPFATSEEGVDAFCQAYNDFLVDWCWRSGAPYRCGPAAGAGPGAHGEGDLPGRGARSPGRPHPADRRPGQVPQRAADLA